LRRRWKLNRKKSLDGAGSGVIVQQYKSQEMLVEPEARVAKEKTQKALAERKRGFDIMIRKQSIIDRCAARCPLLPIY
jgi:hypothetical protein